MVQSRFIINPDSASKRLHHRPTSDGRCKLEDIANPICVNSIQQVDRKEYPANNDCFWCIRRFSPRPF